MRQACGALAQNDEKPEVATSAIAPIGAPPRNDTNHYDMVQGSRNDNLNKRQGSAVKVLIVKIAAVGDVVMALAMLEPFLQKDPDAQITWVCGKTVEPLLRQVGKIHELIVVDEAKLLKGGFIPKALALAGVWAKLLGRRFDLAVTGHSDPRYRLLSLPASAAIRRGFGKQADGRTGPVSGRYHADEYARLATGADGPTAVKASIPILRLPLPAELEQILQPGKKIVALAPGGARNILRDDALRRWPLENYAQLAEKFLRDGFQVLVTGSLSDFWIRESFKNMAVTDLVGQTPLPDLIALYGKCHLVVTHDSGPLHLAVASGVPVLALFGPTVPMEKVPVSEKVSVIWGGEHLACRPCYDGKNYADCNDNQCLKSVGVERVYAEASRMLRG